jgi:hypothetical protein
MMYLLVRDGMVIGQYGLEMAGQLPQYPGAHVLAVPSGVSIHGQDGFRSEAEILGEVDLEAMRAAMLDALRADNKAHVFTLYDRDTQASFQACALKALQDANPDAMAEIEKVWDWIQGQVLAYYYQVKAEIEAATTVSELAATQWDFAANAPTGERINLSDVLTMLAPAPA